MIICNRHLLCPIWGLDTFILTDLYEGVDTGSTPNLDRLPRSRSCLMCSFGEHIVDSQYHPCKPLSLRIRSVKGAEKVMLSFSREPGGIYPSPPTHKLPINSAESRFAGKSFLNMVATMVEHHNPKVGANHPSFTLRLSAVLPASAGGRSPWNHVACVKSTSRLAPWLQRRVGASGMLVVGAKGGMGSGLRK